MRRRWVAFHFFKNSSIILTLSFEYLHKLTVGNFTRLFEVQQVWLKTNKCQNLAFILLFLRPAEAKLAKDWKKAKNTGFGKIKTCLVLNWVIILRPKFTTFQFLISSVMPQKIGSTASLLFWKFHKNWLGPIKDRRTD